MKSITLSFSLAALTLFLAVGAGAETNPLGSQFYQILKSEPACKSFNESNALQLKFYSTDKDKTFQANLAVDRQLEENPAGVLQISSSLNKSSYTMYFDNHNFSVFRGKKGPNCDAHPAQCENIVNDFVALLMQAKDNPAAQSSSTEQAGIECALKLVDIWKGGLEAKYASKMGPTPSSVND